MKKLRHCHPMKAMNSKAVKNQSKDKRNAFLKLLAGYTFDFEFHCKLFKEINKLKVQDLI